MSEIKHYGVIGMKWGVRRGKTTKAYEKASKKLNKLERKVEKAESKAVKASNRADRVSASRLSSRKNKMKAEDKAKTASAKLTYRIQKATRWYNEMSDVFKSTNVSLTKEQHDLGREYTNRLRERASGRYY